MASDSPYARIDQFFASKKRRPPPPKDDKSPSSKGTLENFLVKSPDPCAACAAPVRPSHDPVKRNLTKEIDLYSSDPPPRPPLPSEKPGGNSELKKFASDFLSLYCSDPAVDQESKGKKRNGSPPLPTCSKKQCVSDEKGKNLALRKCGTTPDTSAGKTAVGVGETPRSASSRGSMFSPGDDFWNEAIQVADGLYDPDDKSLQDKSSCVAMVGLAEKVVQGSEILPEAAKCSEVSPLPVKHFDFSREGNTIANESESSTKTGNVTVDTRSKSQKIMQSSSIFERSEDRKGEQAPKGKPSSGDPSLPNKKLAQVAESGSDLVAYEGKKGLLSLEKDTNSQQNDSTISAGPATPNCDASITEYKFKAKSTADVDCQKAETPSSSVPLKDHLQLSNWLPTEICSIYMKKGISKLYQWQVDCLLVDGVLEKRNLVYCASTSAGKSFVAEILMLRHIISTEKMALLVLPYVSICVEKAEHLEGLLEPVGKHVRSYYGNQGGWSLPKDTSVAVCTIEKANSLINRLLEEGRLSEVGIVVIDELHMVGDPHRGYLLELMLTKLRYAAGEGNSESSSGDSSGSSSGKADPGHGLQIVGMSATMPNLAAVADWLQAALYQTDFRPVPLEEYIKVGNNILDKKLNVVRTIPKIAELGGKDPDHIVELCNEVVQDGHSVLLFCSSRKGCESTARHASKFIKKNSIGLRKVDCDYDDVSSALEALRRCPAGLDPILEETLPCGVAYHHAGLTVEEREIIETCYRKGIVRVLTATSTLAAGVNLPARRVIFRQPQIGRDFIDGTRYRQMAGRAGRTGIDTKGESILICKPDDLKRVTAIINDSCPPLQSCLSEDKNGMTHAILEVVAGGIVQTASDIHRYVRCTLLNSTKPFQDVVKSAQDSLRWLCHKKFLEWNEDTRLYSTTPLGRAAFGSSLTPEESLVVLDDLLRAREGFVLASDLHLVYLVTPINVEVQPDWELYYERFMELPALDQSVGNRVGVAEPFLMRMAHGAPMPGQDRVREKKSGDIVKLQKRSASAGNHLLSSEQTLRVSRRFYVALMLARLVQEIPVAVVCDAFKVARGMIQALQENAGRFASMVSLFCERIGWNDLEGLVAKFQNRVSFGVRAEIVELTTIPYVKGSRARALYKAGLRTPLAIAEASIPEIAKALFESSSSAGQGSALRRVQMGVAKKIKDGARKIVLDQAEEARVAAFSAFKSLGVDVPQISLPFHAKVSEDSFPHGGMTSSGDDVKSCFDVMAVENTQVASRPVDGAGNKVYNDSSREKSRELTRTMKITSKVLGEVNTGRTKGDLDTEIAGPAVEAFSANISCSGMSRNNVVETARTTDLPDFNAVYADDVLVANLESCQKEGDNGGRNESSYYNGNLTGKGPINASKFPGGFDSFLDQWQAENEFYFDVHYSKRSEQHLPIIFEVFGLAVCWESSPVYYVNIMKDLISSGKPYTCPDVSQNSVSDTTTGLETSEWWDVAESRWNRIAKIMGRNDVRKITWNLKLQIQVLKNPCISFQRLGGRLSIDHNELKVIKLVNGSFVLLPSIFVHDGIDICLVAWILWPDEESKSTPNLEKVVKKRLSGEVAAAANQSGRWRNQMRKAAHDGCCRRVAQSRALGSVLWKLLVSEGLVEALKSIENPVVKVLADMELWGIGVDMEGCLRARHVLVKKLKELEKEAQSLAGMSFSLTTAADIAHVLYTRLKLPIPHSSNKGKMHPSTNKHSLDLLRGQHPIISLIKEHRTLAKLLNSTLGSISSRARFCMKSQKYIVHGHWLQTSTATGRLSMEEPNLQCVEHLVAFTLRHSENNSSSSDINHHQINARDFFIPTEDNWILLTADYSQIELRLMAHFSGDTSLIELLSKPDGDCFAMIAARWTGKLESTISCNERDQTKRLVYGILYGMGANSLAEQLECSSEEAKRKIQSFKSSFPGVAAWLNEAVASCRRKGYIETLVGRKRFLSKIKFGDNKEKSKAQRQAVNSICQGSAADIIKIAMVKIHSVISDGGQTCNMEPGNEFSMLKGHCRILLQVHDELVLEVDPNLIREAGILLKMSMEEAVSLMVPLRVKMKVGRTWGSLETFQPEA